MYSCFGRRAVNVNDIDTISSAKGDKKVVYLQDLKFRSGINLLHHYLNTH